VTRIVVLRVDHKRIDFVMIDRLAVQDGFGLGIPLCANH
jgi:hypothetical protein